MEDISVALRIGWISLSLVGLGILGFGILTILLVHGSGELLMEANGLAAAGLGAFGLAITLIPYRRRERWAWMALWFYPIFWAWHLFGGLPPGTDHIHQVVFLVLSVTGLLLPARLFFGAAGRANAHHT